MAAPSVHLPRRALPTLGLVLVVLGCLPGFAFAQAKVAPQDIWCLDPANMERVVRTAELLELGTPGGNLRKVVPTGSDRPIALAKWRQRDVSNFRTACDQAYSSEHPDQVSEQEVEALGDAVDELGDGTPEGLKFLLGLIGGVGAAGAGAYGAYRFGKKQRDEDIAYANALLLGNELLLLTAELEVMAENASAGAVTEPERLAVLRQTAQLKGRLPAPSAVQEEAGIKRAFESLSHVQDMLKEPAGSVSEAKAASLREAKNRVATDVGALVAQLSKKAAEAMPISEPPEDGKTSDSAANRVAKPNGTA